MAEHATLDGIRHSLAHLLAAAVKQLWPNAKNAIGPSIENGFYQDFDMGDVKISEADFLKIEKKMREILKGWGPFVVKEVSVEQARKDFANNPYKLELIEDFATQGKTITENDPGKFLDLCKGGHAKTPQKEMQHFKLLSVAGAYWRGDEKKKMLTRIYGTAFLTAQELEAHLVMLEEAKKRDHKKLGVELDLFTFSDLVGGGLPLWTPRGTILRNLLDNFVWELRQKKGYERVDIPHITKKELYEKSGHWDKFKDELMKITTREGHLFAMKPMSCPHHTQIYNRKQWSYRDLPQRYAETTKVYRDEQSGELAGLSRVRSITQDDAHVFCRASQVKQEIFSIWDIVTEFYRVFGFNLVVRLSLHDPKHPEKYLGTPAIWKTAESELRALVKELGATAIEAPGEAALYGPKIDFMGKDALGREHQVATIQLDMNLPERFDLTCVNEAGEKERIVMIHAAIMGSIERFLSVAIEHYAGAFPVWLAPVQISLIPVADRHVKAVQKIAIPLKRAGIRVRVEDQQETVGHKIRRAEKEKVPYMIVMGDKEKAAKKLPVRVRGSQKLRSMAPETLLATITRQIAKRQ